MKEQKYKCPVKDCIVVTTLYGMVHHWADGKDKEHQKLAQEAEQVVLDAEIEAEGEFVQVKCEKVK